MPWASAVQANASAGVVNCKLWIGKWDLGDLSDTYEVAGGKFQRESSRS